jgi:hypothetical protein
MLSSRECPRTLLSDHRRLAAVVVATWNLENLFRPGGEAGPGGEQAYDAKLAELARVIGQIAPDVLAVQEVGDPDALEDLRPRLEGDWLAESSLFPDDRGIRVGVLSRLALGDVEHLFAESLPLQSSTASESRACPTRSWVPVLVDVRDAAWVLAPRLLWPSCGRLRSS